MSSFDPSTQRQIEDFQRRLNRLTNFYSGAVSALSADRKPSNLRPRRPPEEEQSGLPSLRNVFLRLFQDEDEQDAAQEGAEEPTIIILDPPYTVDDRG